MASIPYRIVFVRHGETDYNAEGRLQGQRDIPLNGRGRAQASAIGRALRTAMPEAIAALEAAEAFIASPLSRTRETMELARAALGLAPVALRARAGAEGADLRRVGGADLARRCGSAIRPARGRARATSGTSPRPTARATRCSPSGCSRGSNRVGADCFVVSHGGVARALMTLIAGVSPSAAENADIWQGKAILFEGGGLSWIG